MVFKRAVMVAGLLVLPIASKIEKAGTPSESAPAPVAPKRGILDPRIARLRRFFSLQHCPVSELAEDFVQVADDNHLDWRLLPSISVVESGGGKSYRNNNIFGWDNGNQPFPTVRAGIATVAFKLGKSKLYRDRDVAGKLALYNPDQSYKTTVMNLMARISAAGDERSSRQRVVRRQNEYVYVTD